MVTVIPPKNVAARQTKLGIRLARCIKAICGTWKSVFLGGENDEKGWIPMGSMYGIFTYIWLIFRLNVGKYTIHGSYGILSLNRIGKAYVQGLC